MPLPANECFVKTFQSNGVAPILTLNDDCLFTLLKFLYLHEQLRLSMCHPRLQQAFTAMVSTRRCSHEVHFIELDKCSLLELRHYFKCVGSITQSITVPPNNGRQYEHWLQSNNSVCELISAHCRNLERLDVIENCPLGRELLYALRFSQLNKIELFRCDLDDLALSPLCSLKKLEQLGLAHNCRIRGVILPALSSSVRRLSLYGCKNIQHEILTAIGVSLNLQYLDVRQTLVWQLNTPDGAPIFTNLETFKLSGGVKAEQKLNLKLPKLKYLEMDSLNVAHFAFVVMHAEDLEVLKLRVLNFRALDICDPFKHLRALWIDCNLNYDIDISVAKIATLKNLEELNLESLPSLCVDELVNLIKNCSKLKRLGLCSAGNIDDNFILQAIHQLEQSMVKRKEVLLLLIRNTRVTKNILLHPLYINVEHWLKLSYRWYSYERGFLNEDGSIADHYWI